MSAEEIVEIGHRELRNHLARTLAETVKRDRIGLITYHNRPDGYLVSPNRYDAFRAAEEHAQRIAETVPLLLAAASARVAIPSESLAALGITLSFDWSLINELQARVPLTFTSDEEGTPVSRGSVGSVGTPPELDDELVLAPPRD
jgi:PHD/YefM family antitoxin component YafN of YafNO toxin-antitoxin module